MQRTLATTTRRSMRSVRLEWLDAQARLRFAPAAVAHVVVRAVFELAPRPVVHYRRALRQPVAACARRPQAADGRGRAADRLAAREADGALGRRTRHRHAAARRRGRADA